MRILPRRTPALLPCPGQHALKLAPGLGIRPHHLHVLALVGEHAVPLVHGHVQEVLLAGDKGGGHTDLGLLANKGYVT